MMFECMLGLFTCLWSPARTNRFPFKIGIQQLASRAWAASSIITTSKLIFESSLLAAPMLVANTTSREEIIEETILSSLRWREGGREGGIIFIIAQGIHSDEGG